jgi:hypothetical protein
LQKYELHKLVKVVLHLYRSEKNVCWGLNQHEKCKLYHKNLRIDVNSKYICDYGVMACFYFLARGCLFMFTNSSIKIQDGSTSHACGTRQQVENLNFGTTYGALNDVGFL